MLQKLSCVKVKKNLSRKKCRQKNQNYRHVSWRRSLGSFNQIRYQRTSRLL